MHYYTVLKSLVELEEKGIKVTSKEIASYNGISIRIAERNLLNLTRYGKIERIKIGRCNYVYKTIKDEGVNKEVRGFVDGVFKTVIELIR